MSVRLFVGNLPYSATEVDIRQHFGTVGAPIQIVIPTDRDTGRPRGFAFVDYEARDVAERAIQQLHGQPFKGRPLSVSEARPREARPPMGGGYSSAPRQMGGPPRPAGGPMVGRATGRSGAANPTEISGRTNRPRGVAARGSPRTATRKARLAVL
jgi:cold-inducible RNA-binding protein